MNFIKKWAFLFCFVSTAAAASETTYRCEGTPETESKLGEILFLLTENEASEFSLSLDFGGGAVTVEDAKCEFDGRATGIPGYLTMDCVDEKGETLAIIFNRNDLSLIAGFQLPGIGTFPLETTCQAVNF